MELRPLEVFDTQLSTSVYLSIIRGAIIRAGARTTKFARRRSGAATGAVERRVRLAIRHASFGGGRGQAPSSRFVRTPALSIYLSTTAVNRLNVTHAGRV